MTDYVEMLSKGVSFIGIVGLGFFIASGIVSYTIYNSKDDPESKNYEEEEETNVEALFEDNNYDKKYKEEIKDLLFKEYSTTELEKFKSKLVEETTPNGLVKMYYDHDYGGFIWHCDTSQVPYRFLETVVRKYIIDHDCLSLYVDLKNEIEKGNKLMEKAAEKLKEKRSSVFLNKTDNKELLETVAIKNRYLKFKYSGKLEELDKPAPPVYNMINIDFSTFKTLKEKSI